MSTQTSPGQPGLNPDAAFRQAVVLTSEGKLAEAETIYRAILKKNPAHFRTLCNLASVLLRQQRFADAAQTLRKALNQDSNVAFVHYSLAEALQGLGRHDDALGRVRRAIALEPNHADAHALSAKILTDLGRFDEAHGAVEHAIALAPKRIAYLWQRGAMTRYTADDPNLQTIKALEDKAGPLELNEQVFLHFALAKAYSDLGDHDRSFRHQIKGNALRRQTLGYDDALSLRKYEELRRAQSAEWLSRHEGGGNPSRLPVFIIGMPRSGTTLVEQILASHSKVHAGGERRDFENALEQLCGTPTIPLSLAPVAARWTDRELDRLGALYLDAARRDVPASAERITDKMPTNFRYAGLIHAALPEARIIHLRRDPVDTCLSNFSTLYDGENQSYSYDLAELGRYYRAYADLMEHWRSVLPDGVMLEVHYEDLVDDVERQARRIVAHCGLDWSDSCLAFYDSKRPVHTASHMQVRSPIYRTSVGRPRPARELILPLLDALGLDDTGGAPS